MVPEFKNEPLTNFTDSSNRQAFDVALATVRNQLGQEYPLHIGGKNRATGQWIRSTDPSDATRLVGQVARARPEDVDCALDAATAAFDDWSRWEPATRARILWKAAALLRRRKHEFSAWLVFEAGKSWVEADADTAEAIDFLEWYGREMVRLCGPRPLPRLTGEDNDLTFEPLGVGVIIPPWNFPLAIMAGMTASAIVTGNTVVLKPASLTPVVAARFLDLFEEAGLPPGVVQFLPGAGAEIGDRLVADRRTRFVSFTGSRDVGVRIVELGAKVSPGQRWLKRVVAEMGGKDATIVDDSAAMLDAVDGVVAAAFGYQGQKCSACSRVIATESVYDELLERVVERTEHLRVGPAERPETEVAAVIDRAQFDKVMEYIRIGRTEGRLVTGGERANGGNYVQPTIFADVDPNARIAQDEIFGPVLSFIRAASYDEAIRIANGTDYGLTGAVYARDRRKLEQARREFQVGNLYLNRKCTGALVGIHPFGGFNLSGTDSKTGGPDYLQLFLQAKSVSERM